MAIGRPANLNRSFQLLKAVTKSDTTPFPDGIARGLWVGTAGTANLVFFDDSEAANFPLVAGPNPIEVKQVKLGGTASNIWAGY
jgi:hypothetical protein